METKITDPDTPMTVIVDVFKCGYIHIEREKEVAESESPDTVKPNAFRIMMKANRKYDNFPEERKPVNAKDRLYNDVLKMMFQQKAGFTPVQVNTIGKKIVSTLTDCLWYIDPFYDKLLARGIHTPKIFHDLKGYYEWKTQKKKTPVISSTCLKEHIDQMSDVIMFPWFLNSQMSEFRKSWTELTECLLKYFNFLDNQKQRTAASHASETPIRSLTDQSAIRNITKSSDDTKSQYIELEERLQQADVYDSICLLDIEPEDRYERRKWLTDIKLSFPVSTCTFQHGNFLGNLNFIWRLPESNLRDDMKQLRTIDGLRKEIPIYSTRQMRKVFIERYSKTGLKPAVLREIHRFVTNDEAAPEYHAQAQVDTRVIESLLDADDPDLLYDLRKNNGNPKCQELEPFWKEMELFLNENNIVHERRGAEHQYMPCAISLNDLQSQIASRLPDGARLPSLSTIRYNFWPPSPTYNNAANYTGRFQVKYAVQQRLLHAQHEDKRFAAHQFSLLKEMVVRWKEHARLICLDDKAIIPLGEPGKPLGTGVRPHNRSLSLGDGNLSALDHDFHVCGIVPSVLFSVDIPDNRRDSFYDGQVFVTLKDKVFQPSTAIRHAAESVDILRGLSGDLDLDVPILFMYTDGGPDHRSTFWSVQLACLYIFIVLDLDMLITARTAPMASYANPAERIMSLLNLALQNVALQRSEMTEDYERKMKRNCSLTKVRNIGEKEPQFKTALLESTGDVIGILKERFGGLKWKERNVTVHQSADEAEIEQICDLVHVLDYLDEELSFDKLKTKKDVEKYTGFKTFLEVHTRERQYTYQIKKCGNCAYCTINPPRLALDKFGTLDWLPDPVPVQKESDEYKPFEEVYGTATDDSGRPNLANKNTPTEADQLHKGGFVAARARSFIVCKECGKRRVTYSSKRLTIEQMRAIERVQEDLVFVCGSPLFPAGPYKDSIYVKEGQSCRNEIETTYFADIAGVNPPICFFCGDSEVITNDEIQNLKKEYGIVRPICATCFENGKRPAVRNALKTNKKKK